MPTDPVQQFEAMQRLMDSHSKALTEYFERGERTATDRILRWMTAHAETLRAVNHHELADGLDYAVEEIRNGESFRVFD